MLSQIQNGRLLALFFLVECSLDTLAKELGFEQLDSTKITTVVSELAQNILLYSSEGQISLESVNQSAQIGIKISAMDNGPGIEDIQKVLQNHYSTSDGLAPGLPSIQRIMDEFTIDSVVGEGTKVFTVKWLEPEKIKDKILISEFKNRTLKKDV